jgi:hypothetical protein
MTCRLFILDVLSLTSKDYIGKLRNLICNKTTVKIQADTLHE